jgi:hypothetical protein
MLETSVLLFGLAGLVLYTVLALSYVLVGIGVVWTLRRLAGVPLELEEAA